MLPNEILWLFQTKNKAQGLLDLLRFREKGTCHATYNKEDLKPLFGVFAQGLYFLAHSEKESLCLKEDGNYENPDYGRSSGPCPLLQKFHQGSSEKGARSSGFSGKKEVSIDLLRSYNLEYTLVSEQNNRGILRLFDQFSHEFNIYKFAKEFRPDIITGIGGTAAAHVAKLLRCTSIIFTDTEHAKLANTITFPFASVVCTPSCYKDQLGERQIRYNGYHEPPTFTRTGSPQTLLSSPNSVSPRATPSSSSALSPGRRVTMSAITASAIRSGL